MADAVTRHRTVNNGQAPDEERDIGLEPHRRDTASSSSSSSSSSSRSSLDSDLYGFRALREGMIPTKAGFTRFSARFLRKGKKKVGTVQSLKAIALSSWTIIFIVFIPLAWIAHFENARADDREEKPSWPYGLTFTFCFLGIVPLEHLFEFGGEQMMYYVGKSLGDLIVVTLNNAVEATLAIILLTKCELKLLQSTIIGVIVLHLLLIPGASFITGGARVMHQDLHPHLTQLNHTLLAIGVLSLLLPTAFFTSIQGAGTDANEAVTDANRELFLQMSRGLAIILLFVYICSRFFLHNPPGDDNALKVLPGANKEMEHAEEEYMNGEPEVSQWVCMGMLVVTIALMASTAEWLVDSVEFVREEGSIRQEWFGLILLPIVSFSADGAVAIAFFVRYTLRHYLGKPSPPSTVAKGQAIDLSIQFILFWMPFIVLLAWWTDKPLSLLFDIFEVALTIAACFVVNYVTADAKTNWAEGISMVSFYVMIALVSWFYSGQASIAALLVCPESVAEGLAGGGATE